MVQSVPYSKSNNNSQALGLIWRVVLFLLCFLYKKKFFCSPLLSTEINIANFSQSARRRVAGESVPQNTKKLFVLFLIAAHLFSFYNRKSNRGASKCSVKRLSPLLLVVHSQKPYACQIPGCTKRYTDPSSLRKHVKAHSAKGLQEKEVKVMNIKTFLCF